MHHRFVVNFVASSGLCAQLPVELPSRESSFQQIVDAAKHCVEGKIVAIADEDAGYRDIPAQNWRRAQPTGTRITATVHEELGEDGKPVKWPASYAEPKPDFLPQGVEGLSLIDACCEFFDNSVRATKPNDECNISVVHKFLEAAGTATRAKLEFEDNGRGMHQDEAHDYLKAASSTAGKELRPLVRGREPLSIEKFISCDFSRHGLGANAWLRLGRHLLLRTSPEGKEGCFEVEALFRDWEHRASLNQPSYRVDVRNKPGQGTAEETFTILEISQLVPRVVQELRSHRAHDNFRSLANQVALRYHFVIHGIDEWLWPLLPSWAKRLNTMPKGGAKIRVFTHELRRVATPEVMYLYDSDEDDSDAEDMVQRELSKVNGSEMQRLLAAGKAAHEQHQGLQPFVLNRRFVPKGLSIGSGLRRDAPSTSAAAAPEVIEVRPGGATTRTQGRVDLMDTLFFFPFRAGKRTKLHQRDGRDFFCLPFWSGRHMPGCKLNEQLPGYVAAAMQLAEDLARLGTLSGHHSLCPQHLAGYMLASPDALVDLHKTDFDDEAVRAHIRNPYKAHKKELPRLLPQDGDMYTWDHEQGRYVEDNEGKVAGELLLNHWQLHWRHKEQECRLLLPITSQVDGGILTIATGCKMADKDVKVHDLVRLVTDSERKSNKLRATYMPDKYRRVVGFKHETRRSYDSGILVRVMPWRPTWVHPSVLQGDEYEEELPVSSIMPLDGPKVQSDLQKAMEKEAPHSLLWLKRLDMNAATAFTSKPEDSEPFLKTGSYHLANIFDRVAVGLTFKEGKGSGKGSYSHMVEWYTYAREVTATVTATASHEVVYTSTKMPSDATKHRYLFEGIAAAVQQHGPGSYELLIRPDDRSWFLHKDPAAHNHPTPVELRYSFSVGGLPPSRLLAEWGDKSVLPVVRMAADPGRPFSVPVLKVRLQDANGQPCMVEGVTAAQLKDMLKVTVDHPGIQFGTYTAELSPNGAFIVVKGLRINHAQLKQGNAAVPCLEQVRVSVKYRLSPGASAQELTCEQRPALKLYGGQPRSLQLVQGEELIKEIDEVIALLGPDSDDSDEDESLEQEQEEEEGEGDGDARPEDKELRYGCKPADAPQVRRNMQLPQVGVRVLDKSGNWYKRLEGEREPKLDIQGDGIKALKNVDRKQKQKGRMLAYHDSHSLLVVPEKWLRVTGAPGQLVSVLLGLKQQQGAQEEEQQQQQAAAAAARRIVSYFRIPAMHMAIEHALLATNVGDPQPRQAAGDAGSLQQVRIYVLDNSGYMRKYHKASEPWQRRDDELLAELRRDGCEAVADVAAEGQLQEVLVLADGRVLRTAQEQQHFWRQAVKTLADDQLLYKVAFVVPPQLDTLPGVVVKLCNSDTDQTDPNFMGKVKVLWSTSEKAADASHEWQPLPCSQPAAGFPVRDGCAALGPITALQQALEKSDSLCIVVKVVDTTQQVEYGRFWIRAQQQPQSFAHALAQASCAGTKVQLVQRQEERLQLLQQQQGLQWLCRQLSGRSVHQQISKQLYPGRFSLLEPLAVGADAQLQLQFMAVSHLDLPLTVGPELQQLLQEHLRVGLWKQEQQQQRSGRAPAGQRVQLVQVKDLSAGCQWHWHTADPASPQLPINTLTISGCSGTSGTYTLRITPSHQLGPPGPQPPPGLSLLHPLELQLSLKPGKLAKDGVAVKCRQATVSPPVQAVHKLAEGAGSSAAAAGEVEVLEYQCTVKEGGVVEFEVELRDEHGSAVEEEGSFRLTGSWPGLPPGRLVARNGVAALPRLQVGQGREWAGGQHHLLLVPEPGSSCAHALPVKVTVTVLPGNYISELQPAFDWLPALALPAAGGSVDPAAVAADRGHTAQLVNSTPVPFLPEIAFTVVTADGQRLQQQVKAEMVWMQLQGQQWVQCEEPRPPSQQVQHTDGADLLQWPQGGVKVPRAAGTYCLHISCQGVPAMAFGPVHVLPGEPSQLLVSEAANGQAMQQASEATIVVLDAIAQQQLPAVSVRIADARANALRLGGRRLRLLVQYAQRDAAAASSSAAAGGQQLEAVVEKVECSSDGVADFAAVELPKLFQQLQLAPCAGQVKLLLQDPTEGSELPDFTVAHWYVASASTASLRQQLQKVQRSKEEVQQRSRRAADAAKQAADVLADAQRRLQQQQSRVLSVQQRHQLQMQVGSMQQSFGVDGIYTSVDGNQVEDGAMALRPDNWNPQHQIIPGALQPLLLHHKLIGRLACLGAVERPEVGRAICSKASRLQDFICRDDASADELGALVQQAGIPSHYFSLTDETAAMGYARASEVDRDPQQRLLMSEARQLFGGLLGQQLETHAYGFVGFAVNLVVLTPQQLAYRVQVNKQSYSLRQSIWYAALRNLMVFETGDGMRQFVEAFKNLARAQARDRDRWLKAFAHYPLVSLDGHSHNSGGAGRRGWQGQYNGVMLQRVPLQQQLQAQQSLDNKLQELRGKLQQKQQQLAAADAAEQEVQQLQQEVAAAQNAAQEAQADSQQAAAAAALEVQQLQQEEERLMRELELLQGQQPDDTAAAAAAAAAAQGAASMRFGSGIRGKRSADQGGQAQSKKSRRS